MRRLVSIILLLSHLLIIIGFVWPMVINKYTDYKSKQAIEEKIKALPARANILSMLSEIAKQHEKNEKQKPNHESIASAASIFIFSNEGRTMLAVLSFLIIILNQFIIENNLIVFLQRVVPPPKLRNRFFLPR